MNSGQSFFEVIFALGVAALVLVALVALSSLSVQNASFSDNKSRATELSEETLEWLKSEKDSDWTVFSSHVGTWCFDELGWDNSGSCQSVDFVANTRIKREITLTLLSADTVQADILMTWSDARGEHDFATSSILTRWR